MEPSASQQVRALVERQGSLAVTYAILRRYWKPVATIASALVAFGVFLNKFDVVLQGQRDQTAAIQLLASRLQSVETQQAVMAEKQTAEEARWQAVTAAADIVVSPRAKRHVAR